jgi:hypothetical protein
MVARSRQSAAKQLDISSHDKFDMARTYEKLIKIESEMDKVRYLSQIISYLHDV